VVGQGTERVVPEDFFWADDLATNLARASAEFSYQLGDDSLQSLSDDFVDDGITVIVPRNTNSVRSVQFLLLLFRGNNFDIHQLRIDLYKLGTLCGTSTSKRTCGARGGDLPRTTRIVLEGASATALQNGVAQIRCA
jgi:hypothetical protein